MTPNANNTFQIQPFTKQFKLLTRVMKDLKDDMASMKQHISMANQRRFNMSKEEKQMLQVLNIYDNNDSMRLDKERKD
jgi:hypothetical protein